MLRSFAPRQGLRSGGMRSAKRAEAVPLCPRMGRRPDLFGVGHQCGHEFQNILFTVDVRHGVIAHALGKVDGVEEF